MNTTEDATMRGILRQAYPRHGAKLLASAADCTPRAGRAYWSGERAIPASLLLRAAARCDRLAAALEEHLHARRLARLDRATTARARGVAETEG
jgi:hypothetical protein